MPTYKLHYLAIRARGEPIRLLFTAAGVEFEDIRYTFEEWPKHKQSMPFKQLPVLEFDGKRLSQSYAIMRYLAKEFGLAGKNNFEAAQVDELVGGVEDMFAPTPRVFFDKDEARKAEGLQKIKDDTAPTILQVFEDRLKDSKSGFLVGDGLTFADLCFFAMLEFVEGMLKDDLKVIIAKYPKIQQHREKISSIPKIAAYLKKRPVSQF